MRRRRQHVSTLLPCETGRFSVHYFGTGRATSCIVLESGASVERGRRPTVRIHSACLFGEAFGSEVCECRAQLNAALTEVGERGGVLIYTPDEGRGAGLLEKVRAMELERSEGITTAEAFGRLGHKADPRNYQVAIDAMRELNLPTEIRLISNNPQKIEAVESAGFRVVERVEPCLILTHRTAEMARATQRALGHIEFTNLEIVD